MIKTNHAITNRKNGKMDPRTIHEKDIRSSHKKGDILYNAETGEVKTNMRCAECGHPMTIHDGHGEPESIAYILSGNSFNIDGPFEPVSWYVFTCSDINCEHTVPIE